MPLLSRRSAADLAPAVPCLGRWASLRFAFDPDGFLAAGRPLGEGSFYEPWAFRLDGRRVAVVGTREAADVVLQGPTRFYRGTVDREDDCALAPLLGRTSPLLDLVPRDEAAAHPALPTSAWIASTIADEIRAARSQLAADAPFDIAPPLQRAAVLVALRAIGVDPDPPPEGAGWQAVEAAEALLDAADTPALVVPALRRWSPRWRRLAAARVSFLRAIGLDRPAHPFADARVVAPWGAFVAGEEGLERAQDWAVTTLVGAVDAPVALALDALACRVPPIKLSALAEAEARAPGGAARLRARRRVEAALERRGPIPLLLREVVAPLEVPGLGLLQPGAAVAVDAALAGYPFGAGPHACTGARLGRAFAEAAALVFAELGLEVARPPGRRKRRRLVVSLPELIVRRRA